MSKVSAKTFINNVCKHSKPPIEGNKVRVVWGVNRRGLKCVQTYTISHALTPEEKKDFIRQIGSCDSLIIYKGGYHFEVSTNFNSGVSYIPKGGLMLNELQVN